MKLKKHSSKQEVKWHQTSNMLSMAAMPIVKDYGVVCKSLVWLRSLLGVYTRNSSSIITLLEEFQMNHTAGLVESTLKPYEIPMSEIFSDDDFNCRGSIPPIDVIDLARSIKEHGLQQNIVVQPWNKIPGKRFRIVSGHRRFMAFTINSAKTIPAVIKEDLDELTARKMNLEENLKRKDLNILQEAKALIPFWTAKWTQEMVCHELTQSRGWVQARYALIQLPPEIQQEAAAGFLTQDHIKQLASIKSQDQQFAAVRIIKQAKLLGESRKIRIVPKKKNALAKRARDASEIFEMQDIIQQVLGNSFGTFCMGWAAGHNSDFDMYQEIKRIAEEKGISYSIPADVLDQVKF
jgi:ParB/RepB/Spo0J family partition protein